MNVEIQEVDGKHFVVGKTFTIKEKLKDLGCKFDSEKKAWYTSKQSVANTIATTEFEEVEQSEDKDPTVLGAAKYKDRSYYVIWEGRTKNGKYMVKLITLDAKISFWAHIEPFEDKDLAVVTKRYESEQRLSELRKFVESGKSSRRSNRGTCIECGEWGDVGEQCQECHEGFFV